MGQPGLMSLGPAWHTEDWLRNPDIHGKEHGPGPATDQNHVTVATWPDNPMTPAIRTTKDEVHDRTGWRRIVSAVEEEEEL